MSSVSLRCATLAAMAVGTSVRQTRPWRAKCSAQDLDSVVGYPDPFSHTFHGQQVGGGEDTPDGVGVVGDRRAGVARVRRPVRQERRVSAVVAGDGPQGHFFGSGGIFRILSCPKCKRGSEFVNTPTGIARSKPTDQFST